MRRGDSERLDQRFPFRSASTHVRTHPQKLPPLLLPSPVAAVLHRLVHRHGLKNLFPVTPTEFRTSWSIPLETPPSPTTRRVRRCAPRPILSTRPLHGDRLSLPRGPCKSSLQNNAISLHT